MSSWHRLSAKGVGCLVLSFWFITVNNVYIIYFWYSKDFRTGTTAAALSKPRVSEHGPQHLPLLPALLYVNDIKPCILESFHSRDPMDVVGFSGCLAMF